MTSRLRPLAALATIALLSAGCSSGSGASGTDTNDANHVKALKFSQCMRTNGVGEFPDPNPSGNLTLDGVVNGSSLDPDAPAWKAAIAKCKDLEPAGFTGHKRTAQQQKAALKFAQCIRDNGMKDFADPDPNGPLVDIDGGKPGVKAAFEAASKKCGAFATAAGVTAE
ncbi:MAG: hypothetical protein QOJ72_2425 [Nocardioidaceae bacterium]|jgi:hypothetical protein|nr:hypothetical protein [Nocardioidaceae bacterium]